MNMQEEQLRARRKKRHSRPPIPVWLQVQNEWRPIQALDWNEDGFNFYLSYTLEKGAVLIFKNDDVQCSGTVVWVLQHDNDSVITEMLLNNLIFNRIIKKTDNKDTIRRIFAMVRSLGVVEGKQKLLELFGIHISDDELTAMVADYKAASEMYRYGVKIESPPWAAFVRQTLLAELGEETVDELLRKLSDILKQTSSRSR